MSSKWASDDEGKSDADDPSPRTPNSPPTDQKDGGDRRSRRPRPGRNDSFVEETKGGDVDRPSVKAVAGGWGLDAEGSTTSEAQDKSGVNKIETPEPTGSMGGSARAVRRNHFDNEETEILLIPDLEEDGEEDMISKVAVAPKNTTRRVPTLRELDEDLKHSGPSAADGLDMSLLTQTLVPPEMLEEDDSPWDFDSLLQTVTQEFNAEQRSAFNSQGQEDIDEVGRSDLRAAPSLRLQGGSRFSRALVS